MLSVPSLSAAIRFTLSPRLHPTPHPRLVQRKQFGGLAGRVARNRAIRWWYGPRLAARWKGVLRLPAWQPACPCAQARRPALVRQTAGS